jgi:hypothetical protein
MLTKFATVITHWKHMVASLHITKYMASPSLVKYELSPLE